MRTTRTLLSILLLIIMASTAAAEVSIQPNGTLFLKSVKGQIWAPSRGGVPAHYMLNPEGDIRGDIFGDWAVNPATGHPEVVWSRNQGGQFDIVLSWWDGLAWRGPAVVSDSLQNDLRPLIYHDADGSRYVLWTGYDGDGSSAWIAMSFAGEADFGMPGRMNPEIFSGLLPSAWVGDYSLLAVYEERRGSERYLRVLEYLLPQPQSRGGDIDNPIPFELGEVQVDDMLGGEDGQGDNGKGNEKPAGSDPDDSGTWSPGKPGEDLPEPGSEILPSDPRVHVERGEIWIDWIQTDRYMAYSVWDGAVFGEPDLMRYHGLFDTDRARMQIRKEVLRPSGRR